MSWFTWNKKKPTAPARKGAPPVANAADSERKRAQLLRMVQQLRQRISPRLLKVGEEVVSGKAEAVDQQNARKAIEMFLAHKGDNGAYRAKLVQFMKRNSSTH